MAEHTAVNRGVVGSSPTKRVIVAGDSSRKIGVIPIWAAFLFMDG